MAFYAGGEIHTCVGYNEKEVIELLEGAKTVVVERFATAGRLSSYGLQTIELVGTIRGWCWAKGVEFFTATPQQRYPRMGLAEQAVGWIITPSTVAKHEVDALAHLLAFDLRESRGLLK
jgi:hypothetical protein